MVKGLIRCEGCKSRYSVEDISLLNIKVGESFEPSVACPVCGLKSGVLIQLVVGTVEDFYMENTMVIQDGEINTPSFTVPASPNPTTWDRIIIDNEEWPDIIDG